MPEGSLAERVDDLEYYMKELSYTDRRTIHNLKYFTWREQQEKETEDLDQMWYDREIWPKIFNQPKRWDELITRFNHTAGGDL